MKKAIYLFFLLFAGSSLFGQKLQLKINNHTGYDINSINISCKFIPLLKKDSSILITDCSEILMRSGSPFGLENGQIAKLQRSVNKPMPTCDTPNEDPSKITAGYFEYDIIYTEDETGYLLFYNNIAATKHKINYRYVGEFFPTNKEGDKLATICNEGILKINDDNTFEYILTPDKNWCPQMKNFTYEGSWMEKNDTLYLYNKEFKTPSEPRFSIMDVDTGTTVIISLFNENGQAINIEEVHNINSAQRSTNYNKLKLPFKNNVIEIKDKRIFGVAILPIGYPEVSIVLKKIRASAKINILLSASYFDSLFNGRKFVFQYNVLSEITNSGKLADQYIKE